MLYSIHCLDHPEKLQTRLDHYPAHREHLNTATVQIVLAGPITAEDGETPIGSVFIVDAANRAEAKIFNRADPFYRLDVWDKTRIHIHPFVKRRGWVAGY